LGDRIGVVIVGLIRPQRLFQHIVRVVDCPVVHTT
jgi:hypothetical protein